jgi:transposase-like protein
LSLEEKQEVARLYADSSTPTSEICARLGIGESSLYRILQLQGVPLRGRTAPSVSVGTTPQPAPAQSGTRKSFVERWTQPQIETSVSGGVNDQAIASEVPQTPEATVAPVVGGAKAGTRRRRTTAAGRRTKVGTGRDPCLSPHPDTPGANSRCKPLERPSPVYDFLRRRADPPGGVGARRTSASRGAWSDGSYLDRPHRLTESGKRQIL